LRKRACFVDLGVDRKIMLKLIFPEVSLREWFGLICVRIGAGG